MGRLVMEGCRIRSVERSLTSKLSLPPSIYNYWFLCIICVLFLCASGGPTVF